MSAPRDALLEDALEALRTDIATCHSMEAGLHGKSTDPNGKSKASRMAKRNAARKRTTEDVLAQCMAACAESRKRYRAEEYTPVDTSDHALSQMARFTRGIALGPFAQFLHYVPRLVNVVTLAEALPMEGSGITLPLDLRHIASRCKGSFYAPKRFAVRTLLSDAVDHRLTETPGRLMCAQAVQLAYSSPRARVLIFHTGRLVGTGCGGAAAARLAILRAQRQLAEEANVNLHIRNFAVINEVGAVSLRATLNCDAFATEHSSTSHFDKSSFVGLAWRPTGESVCCEIYSTGRANLPGSIVERQLLDSFSRMLPELLRFSSARHLLETIPEELQAHHRRKKKAAQPAYVVHAPIAKAAQRRFASSRSAANAEDGEAEGATALWDGWAVRQEAECVASDGSAEEEEADLDLEGMGL